MDDLFLKRVLFEWLRDRKKKQAHTEITSFIKNKRLYGKRIDFSKIDSCSFFTNPWHEFYPPHRQRHLRPA